MIIKLFFIFALIVALITSAYAEQKFQSHESIYQTAKDYIEQNIVSSSDYEISIAPIDSQLTLVECPESPEAFTTSDLTKVKGGRIAIGVRCNTEKKWSIFISAVIKVYLEVPVLTQPVQRGEIITRQHLAFEKRDISRLGDDIVTQVEQVESKQAIRSMPVGAILVPRNFIEPTIIKKRDKIIISAIHSAFSVRMNGLAMMDGAKGQVIRIKNQNSGRIINATVVEPGLVSVNY